MLQGLNRALPAIEAEALPEAEVYRREGLYHRSGWWPVAPGVLLCPICRTSAQRFLPFGLARRPNAQCPGCGSVERHRMLWLYLLRHTRLLGGRHRVLHIAPEPCLEPILRALPGLDYRSLDRFSPFADLRADLADLPFAGGGFDLVLCSHVLEHIPEDARAIVELARVLRPRGRAIIMVPFDPARPATDEGGHLTSPAERMARFGHPYHYRINGADFVGRLERAGFAVKTVSSKSLFTPHRRRRYRINRNYLFDCTRR